MSYQECLAALARNGASTPLLEIVATFLSERVMMVKIGSIMSEPKEVNGGCPQGSILGVFLFNATIDDLEEDCPDLPDTRMSIRRQEKPAVLSTPRRGHVELPSPQESPIVKPKKKGRRLDYTEELQEEVPEEPNHWTESKWAAALAVFLRFIDDGFCLSKINYENSMGFTVNGQKFRVKHAVQAQNVFRHVVRRAEDLGMVVNSQKTTMTCMSGALEYEADAYILDADQNRVGCSKTFKALGIRFSSNLDMEEHVRYIERTMRSRYWMLRNLKSNGFNTEELLHVYKTMLRLIVEYGCPVCLLYTSPSPRDRQKSRMPSSA